MIKRLFLIPSLLAAGFLPSKGNAVPGQGVSNPEKPSVPLLERLRLKHLFTLAGHRSHSSHSSHRSHSSHSSHTSHTSSSTTTYLPRLPAVQEPQEDDYLKRLRRKNSGYNSDVDTTPTYNSDLGTTPTYEQPSDSSATVNTNIDPVQPLDPIQQLATLPGNSEKFRRIVLQVQSAMFLYGYYNGDITGKIDEASREAVRKLQTDYKLAVTGSITTDVLNVLGVTAN